MNFIIEKLMSFLRPTIERWGSKKLGAWAGSMYGINQLPADSELGIALNGAYMALVTVGFMFIQASSDKEKMKQLTASNNNLFGGDIEYVPGPEQKVIDALAVRAAKEIEDKGPKTRGGRKAKK